MVTAVATVGFVFTSRQFEPLPIKGSSDEDPENRDGDGNRVGRHGVASEPLVHYDGFTDDDDFVDSEADDAGSANLASDEGPIGGREGTTLQGIVLQDEWSDAPVQDSDGGDVFHNQIFSSSDSDSDSNDDGHTVKDGDDGSDGRDALLGDGVTNLYQDR